MGVNAVLTVGGGAVQSPMYESFEDYSQQVRQRESLLHDRLNQSDRA